MKRKVYWKLLLAIAAPAGLASAPAVAEVRAPTTLSVEATDLGTLLDNPAAKAVLEKYISAMISNPQIDMARSMTLRQLQQFAGESLSDDTLVNIQAELDKIPNK